MTSALRPLFVACLTLLAASTSGQPMFKTDTEQGALWH